MLSLSWLLKSASSLAASAMVDDLARSKWRSNFSFWVECEESPRLSRANSNPFDGKGVS
jgi:hypothetical protein